MHIFQAEGPGSPVAPRNEGAWHIRKQQGGPCVRVELAGKRVGGRQGWRGEWRTEEGWSRFHCEIGKPLRIDML